VVEAIEREESENAEEKKSSNGAVGVGEGIEGKAAVRRTTARKTAPRKAETSKEEDAKARAMVVKKLLKSMETKLSGKDAKASLGDYIRLVQLQKELDEDAPREIKVTWVETGTETTGLIKPSGPKPSGLNPSGPKPDTTSGSGE
jgi:hypothetical protein